MARGIAAAVLAFVLSACGERAVSGVARAPAASEAANVWIIRTGSSSVLIDAPATPADARALIEDVKNRPPTALLLTGGAPSPLGGLETVRASFPDMAVLAPRRVLPFIDADVAAIEDDPRFEPVENGADGPSPEIGVFIVPNRAISVFARPQDRNWADIGTDEVRVDGETKPMNANERAGYAITHPSRASFVGVTSATRMITPLGADETPATRAQQYGLFALQNANWPETIHPRWGPAADGMQRLADPVRGDLVLSHSEVHDRLLNDVVTNVIRPMHEDGAISAQDRAAVLGWLENSDIGVADDDLDGLEAVVDRFTTGDLRAYRVYY